jgi:hypothetical protein
MLLVTADVYSGRSNPSWIVQDEDTSREVLRAIARQRGMVTGLEAGYQGLGWRGFIVQLMDESHTRRFDLPSSFRLANGGSQNEPAGLEVAYQLIREMPLETESLTGDTSLTRDLRTYLTEALENFSPDLTSASKLEPITGGPPVIKEEEPEALTAAASCFYDTEPFSPAIWNDSGYVQYFNNCYNYACNRITDTFAQPGRGGGFTPGMSCAGVSQGTLLDGNHFWGDCFPSVVLGKYVMALVVAPGIDFHWYRYSTEGFWGHKPGQTQARNTDNAGSLVVSPYYCARDPYTDFCGFFQTAATANVF